MIDLLAALIGNWAIWKTDELSPKTIRRIALAFAWLCAVVTAVVVALLVKLVG